MKEELEDLISKLTMIFEKTIPEEENERNEIVNAFKNYLYLAVKTIQESTSKFISKDIESIKSVLNNIADDFNKRDLISIKQYLITDKAFDEIKNISIEIFEMAKEKMKGKKEDVKFNISTETEKMQSLFGDVKEYNQKNAQELISEAAIDLGYLVDSNQKILSLRLYQYMESIKRIDGEER